MCISMCVHVHVYTGLGCKIYFLVGVMVKTYLRATDLTEPNMKCPSNVEVCVVFIPHCPVRSTEGTSMHLGVRPTQVQMECNVTKFGP